MGKEQESVKKLFVVVLAVVVVSILGASVAIAAPKGIDYNGAHFELNLLGKADGWNDKEVDNPDRHTMFVPMDTANWNIELKTPNKVVNHGDVTENVESLPGVEICMTQGDEFAVIDGTVFDGDRCEFQLGPGKYAVYVAARAKPVDNPPTIDGWVHAYDV